MKQSLYIALLKIKQVLKDKTSLVWMFLTPLFFVTVVIYGFGGGTGDDKLKILIVDQDQTESSKQVVAWLQDNSAYEAQLKSYSESRKAIIEGKVVAAVVIRNGFSEDVLTGDGTPVQLLHLQDNEKIRGLKSELDGYANRLKIQHKLVDETLNVVSAMAPAEKETVPEDKRELEQSFLNNMRAPRIEIASSDNTSGEETGLSDMSYTTLGILIIFIAFFIVNSAGSILEDKQNGTWRRLQSTSVRSSYIVFGQIFSIFVLGWIQVGVLLLFSRYVFGVNWGNSPGGIILLFSAFLLSVTGLGVLMANLVSTKKQLSSLTAIVIMPTSLLAGCMWSRELMPDVLLRIADFVPQSWVIKGMTDLVSRGSEINAAFLPSMILLLFAVLFFVAANVVAMRRGKAH